MNPTNEEPVKYSDPRHAQPLTREEADQLYSLAKSIGGLDSMPVFMREKIEAARTPEPAPDGAEKVERLEWCPAMPDSVHFWSSPDSNGVRECLWCFGKDQPATPPAAAGDPKFKSSGSPFCSCTGRWVCDICEHTQPQQAGEAPRMEERSGWNDRWRKGDLPAALENLRAVHQCPFCGERRKYLTKTGNSAEFKCGTSLTRYMANSRHLQSVNCCQRERVSLDARIAALEAEARGLKRLVRGLALQSSHHPFCKLYEDATRCDCGMRERLEEICENQKGLEDDESLPPSPGVAQRDRTEA